MQTIGRTKSQLKTEEPYISEIYIEIYICVIYIYIVKKCVIYILVCEITFARVFIYIRKRFTRKLSLALPLFSDCCA